MIAFFKRLRQAYGDLKLQTKITIVLMIAVTVPVLLVGILFYGRFYNMVISDTIRQEQDASAQTAPLIENNIQNILDAYHQITELDFYKTLFHQPVNAPSQLLLAPAEAREFCHKAETPPSTEKKLPEFRFTWIFHMILSVFSRMSRPTTTLFP